MNNFKIFGKFLDQPVLISKLNKAMPAIMTIGGSALLAHNAFDTFKNTQDKQQAKKEIFMLYHYIGAIFLVPWLLSLVLVTYLPYYRL